MATEILFDTVEDSALEVIGVVARHSRGALITGLPTTGDPADLLFSVLTLAGMPTAGQVHPTRPDLKFNRVLVRGVSADSVRVQLVYETFNPGGPASAYLITFESYIGSYQTNIMPGTRQPIRCSFTDATSGLSIQEDFITFGIDRAMRAVSVQALMYGSPDGELNDQYVNFCNSDTWRGLEIGYWRLMRFRTSISRYAGYYMRDMLAVTKTNEDWSVFGVLRNSATGRFAPVSQAAIDSIAGMTYTPMTVLGGGTNGFVRACPYDVIPFELLFGFA